MLQLSLTSVIIRHQGLIDGGTIGRFIIDISYQKASCKQRSVTSTQKSGLWFSNYYSIYCFIETTYNITDFVTKLATYKIYVMLDAMILQE